MFSNLFSLFLQAATVTATLEKSNRVKAVVVRVAPDQTLVATGGYPVLKVNSPLLVLSPFRAGMRLVLTFCRNSVRRHTALEGHEYEDATDGAYSVFGINGPCES